MGHASCICWEEFGGQKEGGRVGAKLAPEGGEVVERLKGAHAGTGRRQGAERRTTHRKERQQPSEAHDLRLDDNSG